MLRSSLISAFMSFLVLSIGYFYPIGLSEKEVEVVMEEITEERKDNNSDSNGGSSGGGSSKPRFDLERYVPSYLDSSGTVTRDVYYDFLPSSRTITAVDIICFNDGIMWNIFGKGCVQFSSEWFVDIKDYIKVHNFYAKFRFSDIVFTSANDITVDIRDNAMTFIPSGTSFEQATVTGTVYHPDRPNLSSDFTLEFTIRK